MGRSKGGLTTKIHAVVDADGRPIRLGLAAGQTNDCKPALDLLATLETGAILLADKAYDTEAIRSVADQRQALGPTSRQEKSQRPVHLQHMARSTAQSRRELLQQAQELPSHRHKI
jgi:IS5 family transposase